MTFEKPVLVFLPLDDLAAAPVCVTGHDAVLGRSLQATVRIGIDTISRQHARVRFADGVWTIEDLESRHGTWVNGVPVERGVPAVLGENATVSLGPNRFRVSLQEPGSGLRVALAADHHRGSGSSSVRRVGEEELAGLAKRRLDALLAVSESLLESTTEETLARAALEAVVRGTGFACATWVRLRGEAQFEVLGVAQGPGRTTTEVPLSRSLLNAAREGAIVQLADQPALREADSVVTGHLTNALCVPVVVGGELDSFLYLASYFNSPLPGADAASYAAAMARFCALALANQRRRGLEEQQRRLVRDLEQARVVQQGFTPAERGTAGPLRYAVHSRPGRFVAGDICGVRDLGAGRALAFVGDVSGKGMGPALLMTALQSFLDAAAPELDAGELVARANRHFARYAIDNRFATLWLCRADGARRAIECVDAGHGLVFLLRDDIPEHLRSLEGGPPLGVAASQAYAASWLTLAPGDRLVIVTDGVTEQSDGTKQRFGTERLLKSLAGSCDPADDVLRITAELSRFANTHEYADDVTVASLAFD